MLRFNRRLSFDYFVTGSGNQKNLTMRIVLLFCFLGLLRVAEANYIFIPMDTKQVNHLKAYGIAYWILKGEMEVDWLLNYRGGSFMCKYQPKIQK